MNNHRLLKTCLALGVILSLASSTASAQYAVGHRVFGGGTSAGIGFYKMEYEFPGTEDSSYMLLLPTLELKYFFSDTISLDLSVPVVNVAASQALQDYFFFQSDIYLNFHPTAPGTFELFVAAGLGFSYAAWEAKGKDKNTYWEQEGSGYAFHVPARIGMEISNQRRSFSFTVALRPFFSLVNGMVGDTIRPGGGCMLEIGFMAYAIKHRSDRY